MFTRRKWRFARPSARISRACVLAPLSREPARRASGRSVGIDGFMNHRPSALHVSHPFSPVPDLSLNGRLRGYRVGIPTDPQQIHATRAVQRRNRLASDALDTTKKIRREKTEERYNTYNITRETCVRTRPPKYYKKNGFTRFS